MEEIGGLNMNLNIYTDDELLNALMVREKATTLKPIARDREKLVADLDTLVAIVEKMVGSKITGNTEEEDALFALELLVTFIYGSHIWERWNSI